MSRKTLVIGWDAADWHLIDPLMRDGKMPSLKRLVDGGIRANIATLQPPLSPMLWTSIATGKRAYDHGIKGFVEVDADQSDVRAVLATSRKCKTFWNILNEAGFKTNIINWWPSHPAQEVNGVMVSNHYHHGAPAYGEEWSLDDNSVYPEKYRDILKELRLHPGELTLAHVLPFIPAAAELDPEKDSTLKSLIRVLAHCASIHNAATWAMEETDWDITAVYSESIDHFSHLAMKYHPPKMDGVDDKEFELYKGIMEAAYRFHDMMLGRLLDLAGEDCNVILLSDHGFHSGSQRILDLPDIPAAPALEHRKFGVLACAGPDFKKGERVFGASLLDITPTVLHLFGLPVGDDMEGEVLQAALEDQTPAGSIDSWELTAPQPPFLNKEEGANEEILKQLEALGYVKLEKKDKVRYAQYELEYNLCQSLIDGNKQEKAREVATKLYQTHKDLRSAVLLLNVLLNSGDLAETENVLSELKAVGQHPFFVFTEGSIALFRGEFEKAIGLFHSLEKAGSVSTQLYNEIARSFFAAGQRKAAANYYQKTLEREPENATALTGMAQCMLEQHDYEGAVEYLDRSLELQYYQPNAHYLMGVTLRELGREDLGKRALEICITQAPAHKKAGLLLKSMTTETPTKSEPIVIVTGFPRSGTSMMMAMLQAGGLELYTDGKREADKDNPKGFFEHEVVKEMPVKADWLESCKGKAVKVISSLLRYLPGEHQYKLIWIKRPLTEVIVSQEIMKGREKAEIMRNFPFQMALELQQEEERLANWAKRQPNISSQVVEYYDCLKDASEVIHEVSAFLGIDLEASAAQAAVDDKLHRNKLL